MMWTTNHPVPKTMHLRTVRIKPAQPLNDMVKFLRNLKKHRIDHFPFVITSATKSFFYPSKTFHWACSKLHVVTIYRCVELFLSKSRPILGPSTGSQLSLKSRFFFVFGLCVHFFQFFPDAKIWNFHTRMPCTNCLRLMAQLKPTVFQFLCTNNDSSNNSLKMLWDPKPQRFSNLDRMRPIQGSSRTIRTRTVRHLSCIGPFLFSQFSDHHRDARVLVWLFIWYKFRFSLHKKCIAFNWNTSFSSNDRRIPNHVFHWKWWSTTAAAKIARCVVTQLH